MKAIKTFRIQIIENTGKYTKSKTKWIKKKQKTKKLKIILKDDIAIFSSVREYTV